MASYIWLYEPRVFEGFQGLDNNYIHTENLKIGVQLNTYDMGYIYNIMISNLGFY